MWLKLRMVNAMIVLVNRNDEHSRHIINFRTLDSESLASEFQIYQFLVSSRSTTIIRLNLVIGVPCDISSFD